MHTRRTGSTHTTRYFLLILAVFLTGTTTAFTATADTFSAGAATSNITPPLGVSTAGSMSRHTATHIHDELHARCLVLDDGVLRTGIVLVDVCTLPRHLIDDAKALIQEESGIPPENMLVAAVHTHSAPTTAPLFQNDPDPDYLPFLARRIADGIRRAVNQLAPARIAFGSASLPGEVFNRRWHMKPEGIPENPFGRRDDKVLMNPPRASKDLIRNAGPTDPEIPFIAIASPEGRPVALLANYALHYVGGVGPGHVSADYFAFFADRIQQLLNAGRLDPPFVGMLANGASGDINNIDFRKAAKRRQPYEQMRHVGHAVAEKVHAACQNLEWRDHVSLGAAVCEIEAGVRLPSDDDVEEARGILAAAGTGALKSKREIYARETVLLSEYPEKVRLLLQALRIGDMVIAAIPCEVFVETGLQLKNESPFPRTMILELANGYNGYLPTADQHDLGGYETWRARSSYLEKNAEGAIRQAVIGLFTRLREKADL
jgi:neutral ceramidase